MTLSRQLFLSAVFVLLCLFIGMLKFVSDNTQEFLDRQLSKHAEDASISLGLSLSLAIVDKEIDLTVAKRVVDAVWDSGYYKKIMVVDVNNEVIYQRSLKVKFYAVPNWFIQYFELPTKEAKAQIQSGWMQQGTVIVQSNPGFAYKQIWMTFVQSLAWLSITLIIALIIGGGLLFVILKPLRAVTKQAQAICNQQFVQEKLPWTIDLRRVVEAMNNMSKRLQVMFEEQAKTTQSLREQAFQHPVSKLGNRRFFDINFDHILAEKDKVHSGVAFLFEIYAFKRYNDMHGYEHGDQLIQEVAKAIEHHSNTIDNRLIAHIGGASFILVCPGKTHTFAEKAAKEFSTIFADFYNQGISKEGHVISIGVCQFTTKQTKSEILSQLDLALRTAESQGANQWHLSEGMEEKVVKEAQEWAVIFDKAIKDNSVRLHFQKTKMLQGYMTDVFEVFMRIQLDATTLLNAGMFMPMAERLGKIKALDKVIAQNVFDLIGKDKQAASFTINLSPSCVDDDEFSQWFLQSLKRLGKKAQQIIVELPEFGVINRVEAVRAFYAKVVELGGKTSIDNYGKSFSSFAYLNNLRLNFLKIDGSFVRGVDSNPDNQFFIRSLTKIAKSLDILVIAESVETEAEYQTLVSNNVDGMQGYFIDKPGDLESK